VPGPPPPLALAPAVRRDAPDPNDPAVVAILKNAPLPIPLPLPVQEVRPTISVVTSVPAAAVSVVLLAANVSRLGAVVHNASGRIMFVRLGAGANYATYSATLGPYGTWHVDQPMFTGILSAIWSPGVGGAGMVTELT